VHGLAYRIVVAKERLGRALCEQDGRGVVEGFGAAGNHSEAKHFRQGGLGEDGIFAEAGDAGSDEVVVGITYQCGPGEEIAVIFFQGSAGDGGDGVPQEGLGVLGRRVLAHDRGREPLQQHDLRDVRVIGGIVVEVDFVCDPQTGEQGRGQADGQAGDVDGRIDLVFGQVAPGRVQVGTQHVFLVLPKRHRGKFNVARPDYLYFVYMKPLLFLFTFFLQFSAFAQKSQYFKDIAFDSSYSVVGLCQGHGLPGDSLERFWFEVDDLAELNKLKTEWVFKNPVERLHVEDYSVNIFIIKNKREVGFWSLIWPLQGLILCNTHYYHFDTTELLKLHAAHPLHYRSQHLVFDTYRHYADYANRIIHDPKLLFFYEPSLKYEGQFIIITHRRSDPANPYVVTRDVTNELQEFDASRKFEASYPVTDSFNIAHTDWVKIVVQCSKTLYDAYHAEGRNKGPWEPAPIDITVFWRDDVP
jgi:hypothetical protein